MDRDNKREGGRGAYSLKESINTNGKRILRVLLGTPSIGEDAKDEERRQVIARGAEISAFFLLGFLFEYASLPFGAYPFAMALCGASSSHTFVIALGILASVFANGMPLSHIFSLFILLLMRFLGRVLLEKGEASIRSDFPAFLKYDLFTESIYLRLSAISISVFSIGLWTIVENNFMYFDLWGALLGMVTAPVAAYIFSLFFDSEAKGQRSIALASFLLTGVFALRQFGGMGLFLALSASQVIVLSAVRRIPPIYSLALASALGLICDVRFLPMFFLSACAFTAVSAFARLREGASSTAALATSAIWGLIVSTRESFYTVLPAVLCAAALDNLIRAVLPGVSDTEEYVPAKVKQNLITTRETEEKLEKLSESFKNLASAFKRLSDKLSKPGIFEIRRECDDVLDGFCNECKKCSICWGEDYNTTMAFLNDTGNLLAENGSLVKEAVPESLRARCESMDEIIQSINGKVKKLYKETLEKEKLTVFSADYSALSRIIEDSISSRQLENSENRELTDKAIEKLGRFRNDFHTISIWGKRKLRVFARLKTVSENTVGMREFKRIMEDTCGCSFSNPNLKIEGKSMTITLSMRPTVACEAACAKKSAGNLPLCGDSPSFFEGHDNYFYALISDGMGTGAGAALASGICEIFLKEMLEGGNRIETSVDMLNAVIASKGNECSATVDIMELDLFSGNCTFLKSGAASSFILRDGSVYKLSARTMPLGILDEPDTDMQKVRLRAGDTVFLVSDGTAPKDNYDNLVSIIKCSSPGDSANMLCERVIENTRKYSKDDISCVAVKISAV